MDPIPIFTMGYEGVTAEEFIAALQRENIALLLDCRIHLGSRKPGMSKTPLAEGLNGAGIEYHSDKHLGTPKWILADFRRTKVYDWDAYEVFLGTQEPSVAYAAHLSQQKRVCLMCYEEDAGTCHRRFVAQAIADLTGGDVMHLKVRPSKSGHIEPDPPWERR